MARPPRARKFARPAIVQRLPERTSVLSVPPSWRQSSASSRRSRAGSLREQVHDGSGGPGIGACLSTFNEDWRKLVDGRTVVVILSDGWDTGDPEELAVELRKLRMRSRKLVWLNPLLGSPDYEPLTQGMQAALPHLDVFAPAHNLASL